jgi:hypothetical protein
MGCASMKGASISLNDQAKDNIKIGQICEKDNKYENSPSVEVGAFPAMQPMCG